MLLRGRTIRRELERCNCGLEEMFEWLCRVLWMVFQEMLRTIHLKVFLGVGPT